RRTPRAATGRGGGGLARPPPHRRDGAVWGAPAGVGGPAPSHRRYARDYFVLRRLAAQRGGGLLQPVSVLQVLAMGLLARYRRPWILIAVALLAVPMLVQATQTPQVVSEGEARVLTPAPAWPRSFAQWRAWPRAVDRYLADHFGLREELVRLHGMMRYAVVLPID